MAKKVQDPSAEIKASATGETDSLSEKMDLFMRLIEGADYTMHKSWVEHMAPHVIGGWTLGEEDSTSFKSVPYAGFMGSDKLQWSEMVRVWVERMIATRNETEQYLQHVAELQSKLSKYRLLDDPTDAQYESQIGVSEINQPVSLARAGSCASRERITGI